MSRQTPLLSRQKYACRDKIMFVATNTCLSWQKLCSDEHTFVATKDGIIFVATKDGIIFVATKVLCQLPPVLEPSVEKEAIILSKRRGGPRGQWESCAGVLTGGQAGDQMAEGQQGDLCQGAAYDHQLPGQLPHHLRHHRQGLWHIHLHRHQRPGSVRGFRHAHGQR